MLLLDSKQYSTLHGSQNLQCSSASGCCIKLICKLPENPMQPQRGGKRTRIPKMTTLAFAPSVGTTVSTSKVRPTESMRQKLAARTTPQSWPWQPTRNLPWATSSSLQPAQTIICMLQLCTTLISGQRSRASLAASVQQKDTPRAGSYQPRHPNRLHHNNVNNGDLAQGTSNDQGHRAPNIFHALLSTNCGRVAAIPATTVSQKAA